jgi:hypothetical protein
MKYFELFTDYNSMIEQWNAGADAPTDEQVLFAYYSYEDYSGWAVCIFERDGILYEVHDSHCSCNGLENWNPEETSWGALAMRDYYSLGGAPLTAFKELVASRLEQK